MADETTKVLELKITAIDAASPTLAQVGQNMGKSLAEGRSAARAQAKGYQQLYKDTIWQIANDEKAAAAAVQKGIQREAGAGAFNSGAEAREAFRASAMRAATAGGGAAGAGGEDETGARGGIAGIKDAFGRGSTVGQLGKIFAGGGAIIGFELIAKQLAASATKVAELRHEWQAGNLDASGMAVKIGEALPILGQWVTAGQAIREAFTGDKAEIDKINAQSEAANQLAETQLSILKQHKEAYRAIGEQIRNVQQQGQLIGTGGLGKTIQEGVFKQANLVTSENEAQKKRATELEDIRQKTVADIRGKYLKSTGNVAESNEIASAADRKLRAENAQVLAQEAAQRKAIISVSESARQKENDEARRQDAVEEAARRKAEVDANAVAAAQIGRAAARDAGTQAEFERGQIQADLERKTGEAKLALAKRLDDITRSGGMNPDYIEKLKQSSKEQIELLKQEAELKSKDVGDQDEAQREQIKTRLRREQLTIIDEEIASGNMLHAQDKARLEIADKFAARRKELVDLLKTAPKDERGQIQSALDAVGGQEQAAQQNRSAKSLQDIGRGILEGEAGGGNAAAAMALKKIDIAKRFADQRDKLKGLLNDPTASASQKQDIQKLMGSLPEFEQRELSRAAAGGAPRVGTAGVDQNRFGRMHGIGLNAQANADKLTHDNSGDILKKTEDVRVLLAKLVDLTHQGNSAEQAQAVFK